MPRPIAFIDIGVAPASNSTHIFCPHCGVRHAFTSSLEEGLHTVCIGPCHCGLQLVVNASWIMELDSAYGDRAETMENLRGRVDHLANQVRAESTPTTPILQF